MTASMTQGPPAADSPEVLTFVREGMALVEPILRHVGAELTLQQPMEDLVSFGNEGLLMAARTFDPTRKVPFEHWATVKIRSRVLEGVRRESVLSRRLYARLRAIIAANDAEEGLLEGDPSPPRLTPESADARLTAHLEVMATSMALGSLTLHDRAELEAIEDDRGTVEEQTIREELRARVRQAIAERPEQERMLLERYFFEGKTLEESSGGLARSWSSRLMAQAIAAVGRALRRMNIDEG